MYFRAVDWILILQIIYYVFVVLIGIKIIWDTTSPVKTAAYLLLIFALPVLGVIIYLAVGLNYRKKSIYSKKLQLDGTQKRKIEEFAAHYLAGIGEKFRTKYPKYAGMSQMLYEDDHNLVTRNNTIKIYKNGEQKFPELVQAIRDAKHHIHLEYYIYENDRTGREIADLLCEKANEGVKVRFIYDDFGSREIRKNIVPQMRECGIEAYPFHKIYFPLLANRLNYRNHRKIAVIDGEVAFVGGINVCDKYSNPNDNDLYWRDTHMSVKGEAVWSFQKTFFADFNFCADQNISPDENYLKPFAETEEPCFTQVVSSGPDSRYPGILYSYLQAVTLAEKEILITTPYFIPGEELLNALEMAALRGVKVKLLVPKDGDNYIVNAVSKSHYQELMEFGIEVYMYEKGFVHAKTMVCDGNLTFVGTANLDNRSFDLNFEINAVIYDEKIAAQMRADFMDDLNGADKIDLERWKERRIHMQFLEKIFRMVGPLL